MSVTRRNRSIPPTMFSDERLMELPTDVRMTGCGLWFYVDDEGRGSARAAMIRGALWPLSESVTNDVIDEHLLLLEEAEFIELYAAQGRTYLVMTGWPSQDRGAKSSIPPPPAREDLATSSRTSRESLAVVGEGKEGGEVGGGGRQGAVGGDGQAGGDPASLTEEPSPFCSKHQPWGTEKSCGPCGGARKRHEKWLRVQAKTAAADLEEERP